MPTKQGIRAMRLGPLTCGSGAVTLIVAKYSIAVGTIRVRRMMFTALEGVLWRKDYVKEEI
jgi:hypothetical protein